MANATQITKNNRTYKGYVLSGCPPEDTGSVVVKGS
jgi:hypothetical protein